MWSPELSPLAGPAELAVFDPEKGAVRWRFNLSERFPGLPANDFWTAIDQSHMVVAGKWAYVGWVDTAEDEARLRLAAFDVTAPAPAPVVIDVGLGFEAKAYPKSALFDLIAADGRLHALVVQSDRLWIRDPRWQRQVVVAVGAKARP